MVRLKIRKRIAQLNKIGIEAAKDQDIKKAAEIAIRIDECEKTLKLLKQ